MKTKISKILGLGLALVMVLSMAFALLPAKVEAAPCAWTPEALPGAGGPATNTVAAGTDVTYFAVGPDGATIWAVDAEVAPGTIFRSTNGGRTFSVIADPLGVYAGPATLVAVAPDNPNVAIIADSTVGGGIVWLTTDGGINWATLGTPCSTSTADTVTDIAASPAISTSIISRYYFATTADSAGTVVGGDVMEIGTPLAGAIWRSSAAGTVLGSHDYMAIEVTPGFLGDQSVCVVGATAAVVDYEIININTDSINPLTVPPVTFVTAPTTDFGGVGGILAADIALPIDFDATFNAGMRAYVSVGSTGPQATDDVYRIDGAAPRRLNAVTSTAVNSVSFSGTINGGVLFLGEYVLPNVRYSPDPTTGAPTWINSAKPPTALGAAALTIVRASPGFQTNKNVFAGTTDAGAWESALSLSYNGGFSFNQIALIDTVIDGLSDVMPTPDGTTMYLATFDDGTTGSDIDSLWKSPVPSNPGSWDRVNLSGGVFAPVDWGFAAAGDVAGDTIIRLSPDWATTPRLYWCDRFTSGADVGTAIQTSSDAGDSYQNRIAPTGAAIQDVVAEDGSTVYLANAGPPANVYRSTNASYTWGPPVNSQVTPPIQTLAMAPSYPNLPVAGNLLVGGTGSVGISLDGAVTFARSDVGLAPTATLQVLGDQDYATNNTIYCGDTGAVPPNTSTFARFVIGTSAGWDGMLPLATVGGVPLTAPVAGISGLGMENGVFYGLEVGIGAWRTLGPNFAPGTIPWTVAQTPPPNVPAAIAQPNAFRVAGGTLFAIDTTLPGRLVTYADILQTAMTTITSPAGGATIPIDPVNGRAELVTLSWTAMGFSTGLVNAYNIIIFEKALGVPGGTFFPIAVFGPTVTKPSVDIFPTSTVVPYAFLSGREYGIVVQAAGEVGGGAISSPWSDPVFFSIEFGGLVVSPHGGPILQGPQPGAMNVDPGTGFSWAIVSGATEYEFILATDAALTTAIAGTPATVTAPSFGPVTLEYDTDYWYAVRATGPATSPQSVAFFHTMAEPVPPPPPVEIPPVQVISPAWIWAVVLIGAILVIAVIFLIVSTRRSA